MLKTYCEECNRLVEYSVNEPILETLRIEGISFEAHQKHAYCKLCGTEVDPAEISEFNVNEAHDAYREAIGSISIRKMQELLDMYKIGKGPLSELLGWGANTIARQMSHTIPGRDKAACLKSLFDPYKMRELLAKNGAALREVARRKVSEAIDQLIPAHNRTLYNRNLYNELLVNSDLGGLFAPYVTTKMCVSQESLQQSSLAYRENETGVLDAA